MLTDLPFEITSMTTDDLPEVLAIEQVSYPTPWPEVAYRQELDNHRAYFTVVRYQMRLIGYSGMWYLGDEVHLGTIVSHPVVWGRGIGELLLAQVIDTAAQFPARVVTLEVRPSNQPARNLYTKYGFREVGLRKKYYRDTNEDAIIVTTPRLTSSAYQIFFTSLIEELTANLVTFTLDESPPLT
jgi:ribosomal-protein-alanine N-acetyltransferase